VALDILHIAGIDGCRMDAYKHFVVPDLWCRQLLDPQNGKITKAVEAKGFHIRKVGTRQTLYIPSSALGP